MCHISLLSATFFHNVIRASRSQRDKASGGTERETFSHPHTMRRKGYNYNPKLWLLGESIASAYKRGNTQDQRETIQTIEHFSRDFSCYKVICALKAKHIMYINQKFLTLHLLYQINIKNRDLLVLESTAEVYNDYWVSVIFSCLIQCVNCWFICNYLLNLPAISE